MKNNEMIENPIVNVTDEEKHLFDEAKNAHDKVKAITAETKKAVADELTKARNTALLALNKYIRESAFNSVHDIVTAYTDKGFTVWKVSEKTGLLESTTVPFPVSKWLAFKSDKQIPITNGQAIVKARDNVHDEFIAYIRNDFSTEKAGSIGKVQNAINEFFSACGMLVPDTEKALKADRKHVAFFRDIVTGKGKKVNSLAEIKKERILDCLGYLYITIKDGLSLDIDVKEEKVK